VATAFSSTLFAGSKPKSLTGIQLYSVRDAMKTDPLGTLKALAGMGYRNVEHANYVDRKFYGYTAREFRKVLDGLGLSMPSGHTVMRRDHWNAGANDFTDSWKYTVEDAAILGQTYVISPWMDEKVRTDYNELMRLLEQFNKSGELCRKSGMKFGYHNHEFEFNTKVNDMILYDIIMENTDPAIVIQQLDIGNMYDGGGRAEAVMKKYPGRFVSMHVKDEIKAGKGEGHESTVIGKGVIGVKNVLAVAKRLGGTQHFIIEQEEYQGQQPLAAMKQNIAVMKKWGY
jgi:sugar phosphate isomerase/epimerase